MSASMKCSCGCGGTMRKKIKEFHTDTQTTTLADLPVGATATIIKIMPELRGRKKFADVGLVAGTELLMEAHAPFGGLLRVRVLETSMAMHRDDAAYVMMEQKADAE